MIASIWFQMVFVRLERDLRTEREADNHKRITAARLYKSKGIGNHEILNVIKAAVSTKPFFFTTTIF